MNNNNPLELSEVIQALRENLMSDPNDSSILLE